MNFIVFVIFSFSPLSLLFFLPCLSVSLSHPCLYLSLTLPLMSPFLSFSHPCLSFSFPVAASLFHPLSPLLSFSLLWFSLSRSCFSFYLPLLSLFSSFSLSLSHSCLSSYLSLSHPVSLSIFSLVLSPIPVSFFFLTLISFSRSLSLSHPRLSFSFSNPYFSLSHSCISFHLFSHPCRLPLFLPLMSPFLSLSHPCLSFSLSVVLFLPPLSLFLSFSLPPMSHFFISFSLSLTPVSLSWLNMSVLSHGLHGFIYLLYNFDYLYFILFSFQNFVICKGFVLL